jgi:hypothetical protein
LEERFPQALVLGPGRVMLVERLPQVQVVLP